VQSTTNGGKALDRAFSFLLWGNQEEERKSVHFCSINAKGMLIFIVADIWNCYNMDMFKLRYKQEYSADLSKNIIATAS
jgi:hypothetical protein